MDSGAIEVFGEVKHARFSIGVSDNVCLHMCLGWIPKCARRTGRLGCLDFDLGGAGERRIGLDLDGEREYRG